MLILILIDVQYSQKAGFSFEKSLNRQNHISSGFLSLVKTFPIKVSDTLLHPPPIPPRPIPTLYCCLENPTDGVQCLFKTLNFGNTS